MLVFNAINKSFGRLSKNGLLKVLIIFIRRISSLWLKILEILFIFSFSLGGNPDLTDFFVTLA